MAGGYDLIFSIPDQTVQRKKTSGDAQHRPGRLLRRTWVHDCDTAVVSSKSKRIPAWRKAYALNPASRVVEIFTANGIEGQPFAPGTGLRASIDALDETREHPGMRIGRARGQEDRVRMPGKCCDGTPDWLLQVFRNPPIILLLEVAYRNNTGARTHGKLLLRGRPTHKGGGSVNPEED